MKTRNTPKNQIEQELYLYHCAGGHTRAAMAEANLIAAGFRIERVPEGEDGYRAIYWPDGARLTYEGGEIVYRDFEPVAKCQGFKRVARGWAPAKLAGGRNGREKMRRTYGKSPCQNKATNCGFCRHHSPKQEAAS